MGELLHRIYEIWHIIRAHLREDNITSLKGASRSSYDGADQPPETSYSTSVNMFGALVFLLGLCSV